MSHDLFSSLDSFAPVPASLSSLLLRDVAGKLDSNQATPGVAVVPAKPTASQKAHQTAKWARIMTKWLISHSNQDGVKWKVVAFNGKNGQESKGIVDMIDIRKNHRPPDA